MRENAWTPQDNADLASMLKRGLTHAQIGERLERTPGAVQAQAKRLGLTAKARAEAAAIERPLLEVPNLPTEVVTAARGVVRANAADQTDAEQLLAVLGIAS